MTEQTAATHAEQLTSDDIATLSLRQEAQLEVAMLQAALKEAEESYDALHTTDPERASKIGRAIVQMTDWLVEVSHEVAPAEAEKEKKELPLSEEGLATLQHIFGDVSDLDIDQSHIPAILMAFLKLESPASKQMRQESAAKLQTHLSGDYESVSERYKKADINMRVRTLHRKVLSSERYSQVLAREQLEAQLAEYEDRGGNSGVDEVPIYRHKGLSHEDIVRLFGHIEGEEDLAWQHGALCAQISPEPFFPERGGSTKDAKKICDLCEVKEECLEYALENKQRYGIWGGKSERQLRKILKQREKDKIAQAEREKKEKRDRHIADVMAKKTGVARP